jgi:hypothetical protein
MALAIALGVPAADCDLKTLPSRAEIMSKVVPMETSPT